MNYKLKTMVGYNFTETAKEAKEIATKKETIVEFEFNDIICLVNKKTNIDWLQRDFLNSWTMGWKTVGYDCVEKYDSKTQSNFERLTKIKEIRETKEAEKYHKKEQEKKNTLELKIKQIDIELKDIEGWNKSRKANIDPYGKAALDYAENWAKLMQLEIIKGKTIIECAERTSHEADIGGITGFMYGCAVNVLSQCWKYGEELRKWHNKEYGHSGDGAVNPAVLTIEKKIN